MRVGFLESTNVYHFIFYTFRKKDHQKPDQSSPSLCNNVICYGVYIITMTFELFPHFRIEIE